MTSDLVATSETRRAYDHRLREQVCHTGKRYLPRHVAIPRSTVSSWHRRGVRPVVTIEPFDQDRQQLLDTIAKLDRRARVLAAVVRILLALLRASGFSLAGGQRLPEGNAKAGILDLPAQLAAARSKAREERLAANRAMSCNQCIGQQASLPASLIPP